MNKIQHDLKTKLTNLLELMQKFFPKTKNHIAVAKFQLMPLLIWMPKAVADKVYTQLSPYINYLEKKDIEFLLKEQGFADKFSAMSLPGMPSINLHSMLNELNKAQKQKLVATICDVFDEAGKALSKPGSRRAFGQSKSIMKRKRDEAEDELKRNVRSKVQSTNSTRLIKQ